jgi:sigma-B regulation protein RsbU (phosphoserine phosphatase)
MPPRPAKSARLQYTLFALVAVLSLTHFYLGAVSSFQNLSHGQSIARPPFFLGSFGHVVRLTTPEAIDAGRSPGDSAMTVTFTLPEAQQAGLQVGDAVLAVNGHPFTGTSVLLDQVHLARVGQPMAIAVLHPDGSEAILHVILGPERASPAPLWAWILQTIFLTIPFLGLLIGLYVVFARPRNAHAWLILGILAYFDAIFIPTIFMQGRLLLISLLWNTTAQTAMPLCLMLFGVHFPERARIDLRLPWIKWLFLIPILALFPADIIHDIGHAYSFNFEAWIFRYFRLINNAENIISILAISYFFVSIATKVATSAGDARRRLQILYAGTATGLTPALILLIISIFRHTDLGQNIPRWVLLPSFTILLLFPLSLAYVVIVHRAVDLRILIRQGTKYLFARGTIFIVTLLLATWMSYNISLFFGSAGHRRVVDIVRIFGITCFFYAFRFIVSKRLQQKIDQRFFREAYSTEQLLSDLSDEARNFTEVEPLLDTITSRIGSTLHIDRIAVFLRSGENFQLVLATGTALPPAHILALPAASTTITTLTRAGTPANVYRDDPSSWLIDATDAERSALSDLSTELLVPLPGRNRLIGVMALGPKRSEEPYTRMDRQLLQSVASQTGLALENAELLESLTAEVAQRERVSRDLEIAREVQERLFPQFYPQVPGVDLAGYCRPAQAVGGDYYDFFLLPSANSQPPRLALAIGDISGKGIPAALLMASLRASLRSIASLRSGDLASVIRHVNRLVYDSSTDNRYATFFYAEFDPTTRLLTYVNAGHNTPFVLRNSQSIPLEATGTVIGLLADADYQQATIQLHSGDALLAVTDGISEAMNHEDEEWGEDNMVATAHALLNEPDCNHTAHQLLTCILEAADKFTSGAPQHDDMTLLVCTITE